jgi:membrane fusion protein, multidrug efflux system
MIAMPLARRPDRPARPGHRRRLPPQGFARHDDSWSPASGAQFALLPPDNATGNFTKVVQRIPVKIVFDRDPSLVDLLRPGMSVIATIDTRMTPDVGESAKIGSP